MKIQCFSGSFLSHITRGRDFLCRLSSPLISCGLPDRSLPDGLEMQRFVVSHPGAQEHEEDLEPLAGQGAQRSLVTVAAIPLAAIVAPRQLTVQ